MSFCLWRLARQQWFQQILLLGVMVISVPLAAGERLVYHEIQTGTDGRIVPWYSPDPAVAYDHNLRLVWRFWNTMQPCPNGVPYYLQHQVWKPEHDRRGLGGDQVNMALSSWNLLYGYLGDEAVKANMVLMADYWLAHGMSPAGVQWANLPYPYNTDLHSGQYDGDMRAGKGYLQPDKAAAFGAELVSLYKMTGQDKYLQAAMKIADTLAANIRPGDENNSPWPFRVQAMTGQVHEQTSKKGKTYRAGYTTNWTGALGLFDELIAMKEGRAGDYAQARDMLVSWIKAYPLKSNNWGPFFEDVSTDSPSNTETNADTMAMYILEHPAFDPQWKERAKGILDFTLKTFGNPKWKQFGVIPINEQTAFVVPGNSHTSRHASVELLYCEKSGDMSLKADAVARLNWATYMVDDDGKNCYYNDDIWLTDGYGDYVRHYLRAMASLPELAPADQNHLLRASSVIQKIHYDDRDISYSKFDANSSERFKMGQWTPSHVEGGAMTWNPQTRILEVRSAAKTVRIIK